MTELVRRLFEVVRAIAEYPPDKRPQLQVYQCDHCQCQEWILVKGGYVVCTKCGETATDLKVTGPDAPDPSSVQCNHDLQSPDKTLKATLAPDYGWRCTVCKSEWYPTDWGKSR